MLISHAWLAELVTGSVADAGDAGQIPDPATVAADLTSLGLEVESLTHVGHALDPVIVAAIADKAPHPQAAKLTVVQLATGAGTVQVVCGASNLPPVGGKVAFAPVATRLPGGLELSERELRGVRSSGMICSEAELELGPDGDGILVLADDLPTGAPLHTVIPGVRDAILELGVTPNRPDALGHIGVARDLATCWRARHGTRATLRWPVSGDIPAPASAAPSELVTITAPDRCGRYIGTVIEGVTVGPSPLWLRLRLHRLGLRPINNVVDITNLVLLEFGQPLHAFDRARLGEGRIVVRMANPGEPLKTLDGQARTLAREDLVIADATSAQALAGVMGGAASMVGADTTTLLLEAAWFAAPGIRASARRHGLSTDAAYRYERGVDHGPGLTRASERAVSLLTTLAGGRMVAQAEATGQRPKAPTIGLRPARVRHLLGAEVPPAIAKTILDGLEVATDASNADVWQCVAPSHRPDLQREVDLIEELMRHHGLEHVPTAAIVPREIHRSQGPHPSEQLAEGIRDGLHSAGLHETVGLAFVAEDKLRAAKIDETVASARWVRVANPMRGAGVMRSHLLPGLLDVLAHNIVRHSRPVRLFEIGRVYAWPASPLDPNKFPPGTRAVDVQLPEERTFASLLLHGGREHASARDAVGVVAHALARRGLDARAVAWSQHGAEQLGTALAASLTVDYANGTLSPSPRPWLHPGVSAMLVADDICIGVVGEVHPEVVTAWGLPDGLRVAYAEMELARLPVRGVAQAQEIPRFPATSRDLSLEVPHTLPAAVIVTALQTAAQTASVTGDDPARMASIEVLDDYRGAGVPDGHRALLLRVHYAAMTRSVTDTEVTTLHTDVAGHACEALRAVAPSIRPR